MTASVGDWPELSPNQLKNLVCFLCVAGNEESAAFLDKAPDYLVEKFSRYGNATSLRDDDSWRWGLHPTLRPFFNAYCKKWNLSQGSDNG